MIDGKTIEDTAQRIALKFAPEKIILFGSYAHGQPTEDSDVDLLVVMSFEGKPFDKSLEILNHVDAQFPIDLLARRPDDTAKRYAEGDPLIRDALDHGRVIFQRL